MLIIIQRDIIINVLLVFHVKHPLFFSDFIKTPTFWQFFNTKIWNFMTIHPIGRELFHAVRQTYMTKLIVAGCILPATPQDLLSSRQRCGLFMGPPNVRLRAADVETRPRSPQNFCLIRLLSVVTYEIKTCRTNGLYGRLWDDKM